MVDAPCTRTNKDQLYAPCLRPQPAGHPPPQTAIIKRRPAGIPKPRLALASQTPSLPNPFASHPSSRLYHFRPPALQRNPSRGVGRRPGTIREHAEPSRRRGQDGVGADRARRHLEAARETQAAVFDPTLPATGWRRFWAAAADSFLAVLGAMEVGYCNRKKTDICEGVCDNESVAFPPYAWSPRWESPPVVAVPPIAPNF
ncbi:hypothetical protein HU200_066641 [Digitaria exilis]|uniref:Uncharacterized protein n=1 Tax=Digitaria exilis TaxID=1010633 RepID=A0A835DSS2_9POAL|nr:hypothetical protein HU200_066641 [Digitaria exilis]